MSSPDLTNSYTASDTAIPKLGLFTMLRLGIFNMGLGIMSLLTLGVLNRVMITELSMPPLIAAGAIAVHQFMAPARVWIGQMSDSKPLFGYHRSGYIWLGIVSMAVMAFGAVQIVWQIGSRIETAGWTIDVYPWVGLLALIFALYGLALASTSTPFTALLVDVSDEETQSKLVGIGWGMLMVGIVSGVIITTIVLDSLGETPTLDELRRSINRLFIIAPAIVCGIAIISTFGIEKKYSRLKERTRQRDDQITFGAALKVLTASRQTGLFFVFLLVLSLSLFMQDAVLEPYGGQIFGMSIAETTQLNAYFGMGTLFGIVATGFWLAPRLGKKRTIKFGCWWAAFCLILLIVFGTTGNPQQLMLGVGLFGLASGVLTTGSILLMLDLTVTEVAGTFIGAWGLAQAIARGTATVLGGSLLSLGKRIVETIAGGPVPESQLLPAYGLVFGTQAVGMLVAVAIVSRVNIREFQTTAKSAIATALESDMD
ncbi:MFS transporter [Leptolyngbyaceae cyanobacterium CCMR0082]|uniref:MFS transporter n=1 Tax=Adonisia turfae CCMR0082 TaxID=2304604 RepID=A0A6M0S595_9CYAN|nr:BCD family MFS transporter [Adonisia turfae]MDV3353406.1 BCD family MFS transporter [Leptothoe sp. LEGE 181152]NEZ63674.1 MFS transporter [Adonisia turfae CCMR0082]